VLLEDGVRAFHGTGRVAEVETLSDQVIACGSVILAVGAVPQTAFLEGSGLRVEDGVVVDEFLQASLPDIFAAGDVATYPDPNGVWQRTEHWDNARQQGHIAAKNILGQRIPYRDVPHYFCVFPISAFTFRGERRRRDLPRQSSLEVSHSPSLHSIGTIFGSSHPGAAEETSTIDTLIRDRQHVRAALAALADPDADVWDLAGRPY